MKTLLEEIHDIIEEGDNGTSHDIVDIMFNLLDVKNLVIIGVAAMLLTNTFQLRTNTRILTSNALDYVSNKIHPYRSY